MSAQDEIVTGIITGPKLPGGQCRSVYLSRETEWNLPREFNCVLKHGHKGDHKCYSGDGLLYRAWLNE